MKVTFTSTDPHEIRRLALANEMAFFIWELVNNGWREFKETDYEYEKAWDKIRQMLDEHGIDPESLIE